MLDFFRRHQRYFFVIITIVIVISFSFFGTYSTLSDSSFREQIAFKNMNGTDVTRHEVDEMVHFLGTDASDKLYFGGSWGPNFLNDGVIRKNFLETGLASELALAYAEDVKSDLNTRLEKEKRFGLYVHPQARFIGVESAWNYFAPNMTSYYHVLRMAQDPMSDEALQARMALFVMERQFSPALLRQVLRYQEKQYSWLSPDQNLNYADLSLFGYHTFEDWFGPRFVRVIAEFIMNAAVMAESRGYEVSKADALADLMRNSELSYKQNARNPNIGVKSGQEYFNEQLRLLGMDQNSAARVWRQVMLFRRMFQDMGSSVFVDPLTFKTVDGYAMESVDGEIYRLPKEMRLGSYRALQKLEVYLDAVAKRSDEEKAKLVMPKSYLTVSEVSKKTPELVEKRYVLEIAHADKTALQGNVGMREMWDWEVSDKGWQVLKEQFPELGAADVKTRDARFAVLDNLDERTRQRLDAFSRGAIVDANPEWLEVALEEAPAKREMVSLRMQGGNMTFQGLQNGKELMELLDKAPLASDAGNQASKEVQDKLSKYSADKKVYYRIGVIERGPQLEVLTFAEADQQGVLDKLLDDKLAAYYEKIREGSPKDFQKDDKGWKAYADVKDQVADRYFASVLKGIRTAYAASMPADKAPQQMIGDYAATLRFFPYMQEMKSKLQKSPDQIAALTKAAPISDEKKKEAISAKPAIADQWKLERMDYETSRSSPDKLLDKGVFALAEGAWTDVNTPANGDLNFFHLAGKGIATDKEAVGGSIGQARDLLSDGAQQRLMAQLLKQMKEKNAISLQYMNVVADIETSNEQE